MRVLESRIEHMAYDADFGRVEATVALIIKPQAGQPARRMCLRTSQPLAGAMPLEDRLAADAVRLAERMSSRTQAARPAPEAPVAA